MQHDNDTYNSVIYNLGLMNQYLIAQALDHERLDCIAELKQIDVSLRQMLNYKATYDLVGKLALRQTLLVGEGNLSFCLSLCGKDRITPAKLTATTYEKESVISETTAENAVKIKTAGAKVIHGVNATKLDRHFANTSFDNIVFMFPHAGSRDAVEDCNPNFILVRNFLKSAASHLTAKGNVFITAVDSPHYHGAFQFEEAAEKAGFDAPKTYRFDPELFSGYTHTMTHEEGSALEDHNRFGLWVFKLAQ